MSSPLFIRMARQLQADAAGAFGMRRLELVSPRRTALLSNVRHAAMWLAYQTGGVTYAQLATIYCRHHASVVHAVKRWNRLMREGDPEARAIVASIADHALSRLVDVEAPAAE